MPRRISLTLMLPLARLPRGVDALALMPLPSTLPGLPVTRRSPSSTTGLRSRPPTGPTVTIISPPFHSCGLLLRPKGPPCRDQPAANQLSRAVRRTSVTRPRGGWGGRTAPRRRCPVAAGEGEGPPRGGAPRRRAGGRAPSSSSASSSLGRWCSRRRRARSRSGTTSRAAEGGDGGPGRTWRRPPVGETPSGRQAAGAAGSSSWRASPPSSPPSPGRSPTAAAGSGRPRRARTPT